MEFLHVPVMLNEVLEGLQPKPNGIYIDGTIGGAGHAEAILKNAPNATLIGIDRDTEALAASKKRLNSYHERVRLVHDTHENIKQIAENAGVQGKVDGVLIDLGVSSYQLDEAKRGFSFRFDSKLDMRMDQSQNKSAYDVINSYSEAELARVLKEYGEEKFAKNIARKIVNLREKKPILTTFELRDIILSSVPRYKGHDGMQNVTRCFQAIRIEVNAELVRLSDTIKDAVSVLKSGGRLAIISFHSLEDRIVKNTFRELSTGCVCPPDFPVCVCGHKAAAKIITNHPIVASLDEQNQNMRASSAKLRVLEKI